MPEHALRLDGSSQGYPSRLRDKSLVIRYPNLWVLGDPRLLDRPLLGLVCSMRCPGQIILRTYDLARALRDAGVPVIGGFHSPMEKECLDPLLRGTQPVVICPARSLEGMRVPSAWRSGIDAQRVLVVSPFVRLNRRATAVLAQERNNLVCSVATEVVILHANPGGRIESLCKELVADGSTVWTLDLPENTLAVQAGARPITAAEFAQNWITRNI
jgi:predicted Rossmann fold nucleotide-binding protein DprA/Smf involved in DNA uptake